MFIAATDTVGSEIEWALAELIKHPKMMKKAREEIDEVIGTSSTIIKRIYKYTSGQNGRILRKEIHEVPPLSLSHTDAKDTSEKSAKIFKKRRF
ncbi:Flavonoid 3'-monooxygenase [Acorus calamus]|uniref:Flavonoid 3'-monooxygenase n=1 Tax=Acorus calamus TaxID=4465 RepID=A0AAV9F077_ACOCL|nr:Flavonoid 3'-monooxygenase [Acorus calamus]